MTVVTPTDRPKSVRNRCEIELFVALFVFSLCAVGISVGVGLCHRTESDLFLFPLIFLTFYIKGNLVVILLKSKFEEVLRDLRSDKFAKKHDRFQK